LPAGAWYDFRTGERFEGGQQITVRPGLAHLPVFARDGAVIPMMPPLPHAPRVGEPVPLEVRHYGTRPGVFSLFDDDGETFAYERGRVPQAGTLPSAGSRWRRLEVRVAPDGERHGAMEEAEPGWQSSYGEVSWRWFG
jgi:alpha-D-xyloside xylohydrolase